MVSVWMYLGDGLIQDVLDGVLIEEIRLLRVFLGGFRCLLRHSPRASIPLASPPPGSSAALALRLCDVDSVPGEKAIAFFKYFFLFLFASFLSRQIQPSHFQ